MRALQRRMFLFQVQSTPLSSALTRRSLTRSLIVLNSLKVLVTSLFSSLSFYGAALWKSHLVAIVSSRPSRRPCIRAQTDDRHTSFDIHCSTLSWSDMRVITVSGLVVALFGLVSGVAACTFVDDNFVSRPCGSAPRG